MSYVWSSHKLPEILSSEADNTNFEFLDVFGKSLPLGELGV